MEKSSAAIFRSQKAACLFPETSETIGVMTNTNAVSPHELADFLEECSGWDQRGSEICKTFEFQTFLKAIDFVQAVAGVAEEAGRLGQPLTLPSHEELNLSALVLPGAHGRRSVPSELEKALSREKDAIENQLTAARTDLLGSQQTLQQTQAAKHLRRLEEKR